MNHGSYVGRLTADPELKQTQNGISVCSFTLAIDRPGTRDKTDFINFVAWRQTAEFICKYFRKGQNIGVTGYLSSRQYEDKNGNQRTAFEVVVDRAEFVESRQKAEGWNSSQEPPAYQAQQTQQGFEEIPPEEDLPF